ncbi:quinone-dependent dihydroorotate dehydrogenase [Neisseria sicca]|uniref:Dihydroorotate dehydrogenase (quinone) n=1 Tax=Neisseria sicca TaxID=490 RepID=A0A2I1XCN0_NEISI|nr:quinone-dependent dihydroorotate dehydrogenase [Neisseria sicca]MBY6283984.1 quinone-dependent dihydroorotate dehydrogenase [Neisseria flava]OFJ80499.1 dihydroorotate dehydrogenase [Neisseria sp. HMSC072F04]OFM96187.1 dihydroorotate dehydrogenase [Neisseria sp. HMSC055F11]PLA40400.1 quinone-dependent dihydroorotate dehydrogenase [Neisseria sicca]QTM23074.1 quinone-dependent dihydroorotate dehydrogenase [Neisseria sicca]
MYSLARSLLFKLDAEKAHHFTLDALNKVYKLGLLPIFDNRIKPVKLMGISLPNPVGLAAGLDKNGEYIDALGALGFGFLEIGTVTPKPQPGNPQPRLFRVPEHQGIINRMGFNNHGIDAMIQNIEKSRYQGVLGINIGKNAVTPIENAADDYLICLEKAYAHASYITVNISSPNTKNLRALQGGDELSALLEALKNKQAQLAAAHGKYVPLAVKIAPDLDEAQIEDIAHVVKSVEMDGIIATNTTIDKSSLGSHPLAGEQGGLSGLPVREKSNRVLKTLAEHIDGKLPIIGVGGIMNGKDAAEKIRLGATAVQVYSGMIYKGPALVKDCLAALK